MRKLQIDICCHSFVFIYQILIFHICDECARVDLNIIIIIFAQTFDAWKPFFVCPFLVIPKFSSKEIFMLLIDAKFVIILNKFFFQTFCAICFIWIVLVLLPLHCLYMQSKILYKIVISFHEDEFKPFYWVYSTSSGEWDCSQWM